MQRKTPLRRIVQRVKARVATLGRWKNVKFRAPYGFSLWLDFRKDVDVRIFSGVFEEETLGLFCRTIEEGMTVIDVGANIGLYTLAASVRVGAIGSVHSFEPADWSHGRLTENLKLNEVNNVRVNKLALSDGEGTRDFHFCIDDAYNSLGNAPMKPVVETRQIGVTTLDAYCERTNISNVDVIKIDTEGADYLVLRGARTTLSKFRPIVFFEQNEIAGGFSHTAEDTEEFLRASGYEIYCFVQDKLVSYDPALHLDVHELVAMPSPATA